MSQEEMLWIFGVPALVCGAILLALFRPWRPHPSGSHWAGANALAAGFVTAYLATRGWSITLPPRSTWEWLAPVAAAFAVAIAYGAPAGGSGKPAWATRIIVAAVASYLIVSERVDNVWVWRAVTAGLMVGSIVSMERCAERVANPLFCLTLSLATAAAAVVLVESRNETFAHLAGGVACCLGVFTLMAWWRPSVSMGAPGITLVGVVVPGLVMCGHFSGRGIPTWCFLVAAIAPAAYWLTELKAVEKHIAAKPQMFRAAIVVATAGVAAAAAWIAAG